MKGLNKVDSKDKRPRRGTAKRRCRTATVLNLIDLTAGHADPAPAKAVDPEAAAAALNAAAELAAKLAGASGAERQGKEKGGGSAVDALNTISAAAVALQACQWRRRPGGLRRTPMRCWPSCEQQYVNTRPTTVDAITGDARAHGNAGRRDRPRSVRSVLLANGAAADRARRTRRVRRVAARRCRTRAGRTLLPWCRARCRSTCWRPRRAPGVAAEKPVANAAPAVAPDGRNPMWRRSTRPTADEAKAEAAKADGRAKTVAAATIARSSEIAKDIEAAVAPVMAGKASPDLAVKATAEGVAISLTDDADYAMFGGRLGGARRPRPSCSWSASPRCWRRAGRDRHPRPYRRAAVPFGRLRQLAAFDGAGADGLLHAHARRPRPEARVTAIEGHADRALKNRTIPMRPRTGASKSW